MRDIEINLTDTGRQVLFDAYPSARFVRFLRHSRCVALWMRRAYRVFIVGPLRAFGLATILGLVDGSLGLTAGVTDGLHRMQIGFGTNERQSSPAAQCAGKFGAQQDWQCEQHSGGAANDANDVLYHLLFLYPVGIWFGSDAVLRGRCEKGRWIAHPQPAEDSADPCVTSYRQAQCPQCDQLRNRHVV